MSTLAKLHLNTIRGRLWLGFGILVLMLLAAGVLSRR